MVDLFPPVLALLPQSPGPYIVLMLIGFAIGVTGHVLRLRTLILAGIALIVVGALLLPVVASFTGNQASPPLEGP